METFLPLVSAVLIPFIPNNILRYATLVVAMVAFVGHFVYHNSPTYQVDTLETSIKNIEVLFDMVVNECAKDPWFVYEAGLKLAQSKYSVSSLHTRTVGTKDISWKMYPHHMRGLALSIKECRREMKDFRSSLLLGLEAARQLKYEEDINHRMAILEQTFLGVRNPFRDEANPIVEKQKQGGSSSSCVVRRKKELEGGHQRLCLCLLIEQMHNNSTQRGAGLHLGLPPSWT
ncbi:hypothetical protein DFH07DRAFT_936549 [Mycena maculata]|uniref:Uncharacterized protein n=1 Tax=Mycena maculata TaxID=230809 RepID=A0AAD7K4F4_9AGAR|nr:hypothetical protein DFH07DRAFT_936549 [Mycena maculata]